VDLDLDASTALRFHFAEMVLSVPWRAAQVLVLGVGPLALSAWQTLALIEILFHHANVELPVEVERWLCRFLVTPRLHGLHHSIVQGETDSNWSSGLTLWDWLHGTLRLNVPQAGDHDRRAGLPRPRRGAPAEAARDAVRASAAELATARRRTPRAADAALAARRAARLRRRSG
jgi:sterol desaturase/sphingolipid hydroxylase (fatty acid hydroxylase superfamily)